jgi:hypothetical protein
MATKPSQAKPPKGVKPGKNYYWNGREWVYIQQKGKPASKPTAPKPTAPRKPVQTTQDWADAQADRIVNANLAAIQAREDAWRTGLQEEAKRRAEQAQRFAQMVQGMGIDKTIQGVFSNAGHDVAGYGAGFSGEMRQQADASAAETINMLGGDATGVRNEGENMGNVIHGVGGYIPASTLAAQGAAYGADAAMQPGFMLQQGLLEAERGLSESLAENPFLDAMMEARLQKTEISESFRSARLKQMADARDFAFDKYKSDRDYALKMMVYYAERRQDKLANYWKKRAHQLDVQQERRYEMENRGLDAEGNLLPGFYQDDQGRVLKDGTMINKKGQVVKIPTASSSKPKGEKGMTPNQKNDILNRTLQQQVDMKDVIPDLAQQHGWIDILSFMGPLTPKQQKAKLAARSKVAKALWERFSPVAQTSQAKAALRKMISRLLDDFVKTGRAGSTSGSTPSWTTPGSGANGGYGSG